MSVRQVALTDGLWLVNVQGRLDQNLSPELEKQLFDLLARGHHRLIVDLTEVTYINSGGLRSLVSSWRRAQKQNGNVMLCGLNDRLREIFSMIGFDKVFQIYSTVELAKTAMRQEKLDKS
jgi:anti-sigma B factor antagonist